MEEEDLEKSPLLASSEREDVENSEDVPADDQKCKINPLIVIIIILVVSLISLLGVFVFVRREQVVPVKNREVCRTDQCATISHQLSNWGNPSVDPCEDFYEHSCGRYSEHSGVDGTRLVEKEMIVKKLIREFAQKNVNETSKSRSENVLRQLYLRCHEIKDPVVAQSKEESMYKEVLANILKIGKWPTMEGKNWNDTMFDINDYLSNMSQLHMLTFGLFRFSLYEYPILGTLKHLSIARIEEESLVTKQELLEFASTILLINGYDHMKKDLEKDLNGVIQLTERLKKIPDNASFPIHLDDFIHQIPSINFERIIKNLLPPSGNWTKLRSKVSSPDILLFFSPQDNLEKVIKETSPRVLANFLIFKYLEYAYFYTSTKKQVLDARSCEEIVVAILPRASLRVFVHRYFKKENLKLASDIVEKLKTSYVEMLRNSSYLHPQTRDEAIRKVELMKQVVGYTEEYEKPGELDRIFESLKTEPTDSFYTLFTKIKRFRTEQLVEFITSDSLLNPIEPLIMTNAFYFPFKNTLNILVPFLDDPLFDSAYPEYVNEAGIGRVLSHEIGHSFDENGRTATSTGALSSHWWHSEDWQKYHENVDCIKDQYEAFVDPDLGRTLNGTPVVSELIADVLGTEVGWRMFQKLDLSKQMAIHRFENKSIEEMYFRIAALDFCAPPHRKTMSKEPTHPTNRYRINGIFSNFEPFAKTFGCSKGTPMNKEEKCKLF